MYSQLISWEHVRYLFTWNENWSADGQEKWSWSGPLRTDVNGWFIDMLGYNPDTFHQRHKLKPDELWITFERPEDYALLKIKFGLLG